MIDERLNKGTAIVVFVLVGALFFWAGGKYAEHRIVSKPLVIEEIVEQELIKEEPVYIYVHVAGAVENPGLYKLEQGARLEEALKLAGIKENAEVDLFLNRAQLLADGEKVYVPEHKEVDEQQVANNTVTVENYQQPKLTHNTPGKLNINNASQKQLEDLSGIGPSKAQAIIDYRRSKGGFSSIEEIMNVKGIGGATFEKIKNSITI